MSTKLTLSSVRVVSYSRYPVLVCDVITFARNRHLAFEAFNHPGCRSREIISVEVLVFVNHGIQLADGSWQWEAVSVNDNINDRIKRNVAIVVVDKTRFRPPPRMLVKLSN